MKSHLKIAFDNEMSIARDFYAQGQFTDCFRHLERAHVLGQFYVVPHTKTHIWMLYVGIRTRNFEEIAGQLIRIPGGIIGSAIGKVPVGNTGGANIKLTTVLPIPEDLKAHLDFAE